MFIINYQQQTTMANFKLTSTAIQEKANGKYDWYELELLLPHEAIRIEFLRAEMAINNMEPIKNPWHILSIHRWFVEFLLPSIHEHHDLEEEVLGPFYANLGENVEFGQSHKHDELLQQMKDFLDKSKDLCLLVTTPTAPFLLLLEKEEKFRSSFHSLKNNMFAHLHEEELYWPGVLQKHGLERAAICQNLLSKRGFGKKGADYRAFKAFAGAVFYNAGSGRRIEKSKLPTVASVPGTLQELPPWCAKEVIEGVKVRVPLVARLFILPSWQRQYERKWKRLIESVSAADHHHKESAKHRFETIFHI